MVRKGPGREPALFDPQAAGELEDGRLDQRPAPDLAEAGPAVHRGFDAPVAAVAARAGVGMGSLYRRYGSKTELLQRLCMLAMEQAIEAAEAAIAAEDGWTGLADCVRRCVAFGSGALAPLAGAIETTPEMWRASRRGRELLDAVLSRAQREEGLRPDLTTLDIAWLVEHFSRRAATPGSAEGDNVGQRLLAIALDGLRARQAERLPGTPPTVEHYVGRWKHAPSSPGAGRAP